MQLLTKRSVWWGEVVVILQTLKSTNPRPRNHSLTLSLTHTHEITHSLTHSLTHTHSHAHTDSHDPLTDLFRKPDRVDCLAAQLARHATHGAVYVDNLVLWDARQLQSEADTES